MTPVINPWVFYLMPICENIGCVSTLLAALLTIASIFLIILTIVFEMDNSEEEAKILKPLRNKVTTAAIILILISVLIPSEKTITKMIIAQNVTYERVEVAADTVETVYNDIMELFDNKETE